jgi:guanine deaminase
MTIVVVEKNDVTRKLVAGILVKKGYHVLEAATAQEAAGLLTHGPELFVVGHEVDLARYYLPKTVILPDTALSPDNLIISVEKALSKAGHVPSTPEGYMRRAIDISQEKMDENCGGPFGAVVVRDGKIIAEGWNMVTSSHDPTAHAEVVAIRRAAASLGTFSLEGCEIYTSCEPCPMCLAAIYWARLDRVYFANTREDAEKIGFDDDFIYREFRVPDNERALPAKMILRPEAQIVFDNWMRKSDKTPY